LTAPAAPIALATGNAVIIAGARPPSVQVVHERRALVRGHRGLQRHLDPRRGLRVDHDDDVLRLAAGELEAQHVTAGQRRGQLSAGAAGERLAVQQDGGLRHVHARRGRDAAGGRGAHGQRRGRVARGDVNHRRGRGAATGGEHGEQARGG